jgi:hypothetical protein
MATDALLVVQASVTKTADFNSTAVSLPGGTPRGGFWVRVIYSAASLASGTGHFDFNLETSPDSGSNYYLHTSGRENRVTLSTTAASGEFWLPLETSDSLFRLVCDFTDDGSANTQTITYKADLVTGRPA